MSIKCIALDKIHSLSNTYSVSKGHCMLLLLWLYWSSQSQMTSAQNASLKKKKTHTPIIPRPHCGIVGNFKVKTRVFPVVTLD